MVIGREAERARIDALLESARRGRTGALVIVGEPGIGKPALLDEACVLAAGMRLLRLPASEGESTLPFAGLDALLRPLVGLLSRLEPPQRRALRIALALEEGDDPDLLAVNAGALTLLGEAAGEQPVLVAVDDAHWLDGPSADAFAFAARRLEGEDLAFVVTVRSGERSVFLRGLERIELEPLGREEARELLVQRREAVAAGGVDRMLELAAGNPLALLELPAAVVASVDEVTVPERIRQSFASRLDSLPEPSRSALVLAAAEPDPAAVRRAAELLGVAGDALLPAESAGLVHVKPTGMVFRHPLVRSLVYSSTEPADRRAAHRALAEVLPGASDRDRRAWHLAAAATEPDEGLAALLEETADRAEARGGHAAAAQALERAARLSIDTDSSSRRLVRAARLAFWAGDADRGVQLTREAFDATADPALRVHALLELASIRGAQAEGYETQLLESLPEVDALDPDDGTRLYLMLVGRLCGGLDAAGAVETADQLVEVARRAGEWWRPRGLLAAAGAYLAAGKTERFEALLAEVDDDTALANNALDLLWAERYDLARNVLDVTLRDGRAAGNRMRVIWNQACTAQLELRLGRLAQSAASAAEAVTLGDTYGIATWASIARGALAGVQAWRGDADACRVSATEAIAAAQEAGLVSEEVGARAALGLLWLGLGRPESVVDELAPIGRRWLGSTLVEPSGVPFVPDLVEAHARLGERDEAEVLLRRFRANGEHAQRRWALAAVARCDGILAGTEGFESPFGRSLELLASSPLALDRARTQLAYGERLRRAGQRREARAHLRAAHEVFAAVDAAPWADRAGAELRATGETVGPRTPDRRAQLTPQELQIAGLVGEGKTNKEIAAQLYLSPKTIEYHLGNTYRKLGVHSRVELARIVATEQ